MSNQIGIPDGYFKFNHDDMVASNTGVIGRVSGVDANEDGNVYSIVDESGGTYYFTEKNMHLVDVMSDPVNHPSHYTVGGIETIDYMRSRMTSEQFAGYCLGNTLKYLSRANFKGKYNEDIAKAKVYFDWFYDIVNGDFK